MAPVLFVKRAYGPLECVDMISELTLVGRQDGKVKGHKIDINEGTTRAQVLNEVWLALGKFGVPDRTEEEHDKLIDRVR